VAGELTPMDIKDLLRTLPGAEATLIIRFHGAEFQARLNADLVAETFSGYSSTGMSMRAVENAANEDEACRGFLEAVGVKAWPEN
jgi:hypothetical protein